MSDNSKIEWTDATWNPVTGCTRVSPGCDHCYALTLAERFRGTPGHYFEHGFDVQLRPDKLDQPLRWKKPRKVFVNSMSDLFHKDIPDEYIARVFAVMALAPRHTFQVLTKRHGRMRSLLSSPEWSELLVDVQLTDDEHWPRDLDPEQPLPNVWLGVSAEDQHWATIRLDALRQTPAAVRFVSMEPLLGAIETDLAGIDWVIVGGESGRGARPMNLDWARSIRDQCAAAGVAFHYKQQGSGDGGPKSRRDLDGRTWDEFPERAA
jgi:protein gp37